MFHLPVRGSGDGGHLLHAADISAFWQALFAGRIVSSHWVAEMVRPRSDVPAERSATASASGCTGQPTP